MFNLTHGSSQKEIQNEKKIQEEETNKGKGKMQETE